MSVSKPQKQRNRVYLLSDLRAIEAFVAVAQTQSLTKAGHRLGVGVSTISKKLAELEGRAKTRLLNRTTRQISLSEEGKKYYQKCLKIVEEIEIAESELWDQSRNMTGRLKITAPLSFGRSQIAPLIMEFLRLHPDIRIDLRLSTKFSNLVEEGFDVAIRFVAKINLQHSMRVISANRRLFCASPEYLKKFGTPKIPQELEVHNCVVAASSDMFDKWPVLQNGQVNYVHVSGVFTADNVDILRNAALEGFGIALLGSSLVSSDVRHGRLIEILKDYTVDDSLLVAMVPGPDFIPRRVSAFIDFLCEKIGDPPIWES